MDIILLQKVANLGNIGDRVKVKSGFGRNYLLGLNAQLTAFVYMPGTSTADMGGSAETTKAYLTVRDSSGAYSGTSTAGKVTVAQFTAPPPPTA